MIEIRNLTRTHVPLTHLRKAAENLLRSEKKRSQNLSIAVVDEKRMREISKTYKGKNKAANVLSFPFSDVQGKPIAEFGLGEVVLCKNEIAKDAKKYGITIQQAMSFMLAHGIWHLLGYSHNTMKKKESLFLSGIQ